MGSEENPVHDVLPTEIRLQLEDYRISTFRNWPVEATQVDARKFAKAGFFHTGTATQIKCSFCGSVFNSFNHDDEVIGKHLSESPNCQLATSVDQSESAASLDSGSVGEASSLPNSMNSSQGFSGSDNNNDSQTSNIFLSPLESFKKESLRLMTFERWPLSFIFPKDLAAAGFIYTGQRDCVRCVFCGEYVGEWNVGDVAMREHASLFPHCPFVQGKQVGNITIEECRDVVGNIDSANEDNGSTIGYDDTGIRPSNSPTHQIHKGCIPSSSSTSTSSVLNWKCCVSGSSRDGQVMPGEGTGSGSGIIQHSGPAHPAYSTLDSRLRTFLEWPPALKQQPQALAQAGFYYNGKSDQVKCFYCDGGLRNWQPQDNPWTEHARWFSRCGFVRLVKGDDFIQKCVVNPNQISHQDDTGGSSGCGRDNCTVLLESEWRRLVCESEVIRGALNVGIDLSRIKMAIRQNQGREFNSVNQLVESALKVHINQEARAELECGGGSSPCIQNPLSSPPPSHFAPVSSSPSSISPSHSSSSLFTCPPSSSNPCPSLLSSNPCGASSYSNHHPSSSQVILHTSPDLRRHSLSVPQSSSSTTLQPPTISTNDQSRSSNESSRIVHREGEMAVDMMNDGGGHSQSDTAVTSLSSTSRLRSSLPPISQNQTDDDDEIPGGDVVGRCHSLSSSYPPHLSSTSSSSLINASRKGQRQKSPAISSLEEEGKGKGVIPPLGHDLERENRRLKEERTCKICMDSEIGVVFIPCGHLICCVHCAPALKDCPLCRKQIQGTVKTYLS